MPRRRPEPGPRPGGRPGPGRQLGATAGPEENSAGRDTRTTRSAPRRPASAQTPAAPCSAPARRPRHPQPLTQSHRPVTSDQYELPAAFANSQRLCGAGPVTPCSMSPSHWLGGETERRGERERRGAGRSPRRPRLPPLECREPWAGAPTACWGMKSFTDEVDSQSLCPRGLLGSVVHSL